jgi:pleuromutilin/lincosamide/streptogramin A transport system ATP-binding/permease protein
MSLIQIRKIEKTIREKELFKIDYIDIHPGDRIGLVGKNGSGKSSLLKVIAGDIESDSGYVKRKTSVVLLPQLKRTDTTKSGGEMTAEYVIQALNENPAVLLADEPTTHLDTTHIEWLEKEFRLFKGAYVVVSHDRDFLDKVCETIWELEDGKLTVYSGSYSRYEAEKEKECKSQQVEYEKYRKKERQLEEARKKKAEKASAIEEESKSFYFRKKAKKLNKVAKAIESRMEQLEEVEKPIEKESIKMELPNMEKLRNRFVFRGFDVGGEVQNKKLWHPTDFSMVV